MLMAFTLEVKVAIPAVSFMTISSQNGPRVNTISFGSWSLQPLKGQIANGK
jgi:hypothetical protein